MGHLSFICWTNWAWHTFFAFYKSFCFLYFLRGLVGWLFLFVCSALVFHVRDFVKCLMIISMPFHNPGHRIHLEVLCICLGCKIKDELLGAGYFLGSSSWKEFAFGLVHIQDVFPDVNCRWGLDLSTHFHRTLLPAPLPTSCPLPRTQIPLTHLPWEIFLSLD